MTNTEKTRILKEMRKRIEVGSSMGLCHALNIVTSDRSSEIQLSDLGISRPDNADTPYWFPEFNKAPRLKLIDEALAKCETKFKVGDRVECIKSTPIYYSVGEKATVCHTDNSQDVNIRIKKDNGKETWAYGSDFKLITELDPIQQAEQRVKDAQAELERLRNTPKDAKGLYRGQEMYFLYGNGDIEDANHYCKDAFLSKERAEKELLRVRLAFIADSLNGGLLEIDGSDMRYFICHSKQSDRIETCTTTTYAYGFVLFKTPELAEEAMTYFTKEELIKMLK